MRRISVLIAITLAQPALAAGVKQSIRLDRQIARMQVSQANSQPAMPLNQQPDQQPKLQREQAADLQQIYQDAKTQDATFASAQAAYQAGLERFSTELHWTDFTQCAQVCGNVVEGDGKVYAGETDMDS